MGRVALVIVLLHWALITYGFFQPHAADGTYNPLFYMAFLHLSPVLVVFNLLSMLGSNYGGHFTAYMVLGLLLAFCKYGSLFFAIRQDGFDGVNMATSGLEILYLASSGYYLAQLNYI